MPDPMGDLSYTWPFYAAFAVAYLFGSIPFGLILTRLAGLGDIRSIGSGNIGATNVLRTGNKKLAALTLLLDALKGAVPVLIAKQFGPDLEVLASAGAVIGHIAPLWLKFRGGKGLATAIGVLWALAWPVGLLVCVTWLAVAYLARYSSLAGIVSIAASPLYAWWLATPQKALLAALIAILVVLRHVGNIRRLLSGTESKIGARKTEAGMATSVTPE